MVLKDQIESLHAAIKAIKETHRIELERQGKEEYALKSFKDEDVRKFKQCIEKQAKAYEFNLPNRGYDIYAFAKDLLVWLEKQGEQKFPIEKLPFETKTPEESLGIDSDTYNKIVEECVYGEQKPADNVEPKFNVGDWVIDKQGIVHQIANIVENVTNHTYGYDIVGGGYFNDNTEGIRLWTIQDAKDGDVLVHNNCTFIFMGIKDGIVQALEENLLDGTNPVSFGEPDIYNDYHPATKEQRDTLMKAMTNAGYTFDFEKKELKKIENEIEIPFGAKDSELQEVTYYIPKGFHAEINDDKVVIKKGEKSIAWSEEDEKVIHCLEYTVRHFYEDEDTIKWCCDWLKSLKNKVQPTQVWSVEDKLMLMSCIEIMQTVDSTEEQQNWLKSLRPQNHWKPSEEQIKALYDAVFEANWETMDIDSLESLYNDLKKL